MDESQKTKDKSEDSENEGSSKVKKDGEDKGGDNAVDLSESVFSNVTDKNDVRQDDRNKVLTYFDLPLGKFFMQIGMNLVQEYVQTDRSFTDSKAQTGQR